MMPIGYARLALIGAGLLCAPLANAQPAGGFDQPAPALDLNAPQHLLVAGLSQDESLAGPARSASLTSDSSTATSSSTGLLNGRVRAGSAAGAGGMAGGVLALEGLAALARGD
jgi:hypothetical protein